MKKRLLFVIAEAGSAGFCLPLWQHWQEQRAPLDWSILATETARRFVSDEIEASRFLDQNWGDLPKLEDFDVVVSSATGNSFERAIAAACAKAHTKLVQFLDVDYDTEKRLKSSNMESTAPHALAVIHGIVKPKARAFGLPEEAIHVTGHPAWEKTLLKSPEKGPVNVIAFAAQPLSEITALADLGYDEHKAWALLCKAQQENPALIKELIYCPHPAQTLIPEVFQNGSRLKMADENILGSAGTLVSMFSAIMIDAFLAGHRVISLQPNLRREDRCLLSQLNLIPLIIDDKPKTLLSTLEKPSSLSSEAEEFKSSYKASRQRFEDLLLS